MPAQGALVSERDHMAVQGRAAFAGQADELSHVQLGSFVTVQGQGAKLHPGLQHAWGKPLVEEQLRGEENVTGCQQGSGHTQSIHGTCVLSQPKKD